MSTGPSLVYYDRGLRRWRDERVYARGFLRWLYNTRSGGLLAPLVVGTAWPSRAWAAWQRTRWSRRRIAGFAEEMGIDLSESATPVEAFASFAEFFTRRLRPGRRPVCAEPGVCVAPADGKVLAYPRVEAGATFRIKRATFGLEALLQDAALAAAFAGGSMLVSRLGLADYHHFHFPDSGVPGPPRTVRGRYHAGGPYSAARLVPFYAENHRMVTVFDSDHFGRMALVEIGALTVGSIRQRFRPGVRVAKGEPKGVFELGGSTVVLLFPPGAVRLDAEICALTRWDLECYLRMGEAVGRAAGGRRSHADLAHHRA